MSHLLSVRKQSFNLTLLSQASARKMNRKLERGNPRALSQYPKGWGKREGGEGEDHDREPVQAMA